MIFTIPKPPSAKVKRVILTAAFAVAAIRTFGQGYVQFQNTPAEAFYFESVASSDNRVSMDTIGSQTGNGSTGVVEVGLFWSTSIFTDPSQGTLADIATMSDPNLGYVPGTPIIAAPGVIDGNSSLAIGGTSPGEQIYIQLFAWDSNFANPDAALAAGAFFGASSAGRLNTIYGAIGAPQLLTTASPTYAPSTPIFGPSLPFFFKTVLLQSPEPASIAFGSLGAVSLLLFHRRKHVGISPAH
jgi:hypothetical protein